MSPIASSTARSPTSSKSGSAATTGPPSTSPTPPSLSVPLSSSSTSFSSTNTTPPRRHQTASRLTWISSLCRAATSNFDSAPSTEEHPAPNSPALLQSPREPEQRILASRIRRRRKRSRTASRSTNRLPLQQHQPHPRPGTHRSRLGAREFPASQRLAPPPYRRAHPNPNPASPSATRRSRIHSPRHPLRRRRRHRRQQARRHDRALRRRYHARHLGQRPPGPGPSSLARWRRPPPRHRSRQRPRSPHRLARPGTHRYRLAPRSAAPHRPHPPNPRALLRPASSGRRRYALRRRRPTPHRQALASRAAPQFPPRRQARFRATAHRCLDRSPRAAAARSPYIPPATRHRRRRVSRAN